VGKTKQKKNEKNSPIEKLPMRSRSWYLTLLISIIVLCHVLDINGVTAAASSSSTVTKTKANKMTSKIKGKASSTINYDNNNDNDDVANDGAAVVTTESSIASRFGRVPSRFAYVMIHYEGTPNDDAYILGLRVLIHSIK
jgi:hypothetical protein